MTRRASGRFAEYVRKIKCDEWREVSNKDDCVVIEHVPTGKTLAYGTHDGGNDWNGPRNFALEVQRICGCRLIEPRGRKRSRKSLTIRNEAVEAARRKYREAAERRARENDRLGAERAQSEAEARAAAERAERHRRLKPRLVQLLLEREEARREHLRNPSDAALRLRLHEAHLAYIQLAQSDQESA